MQDSRILSTFTEEAPPRDAPARPAAQGPALVFDACSVGVILRSVLFVEGVLGIAVMFEATTARGWVLLLALMTVGALPATLIWLLVICAAKRVLARLRASVQWAAGIVLGALVALYGCGTVWFMGFVPAPPWVASAFTGAAIAAGIVGGLMWRARARMPADQAARLSELQARIRPHFLFNTLNSAIALVREDPARAERVLEDLSELFRHVLAEPGEAVTLAEEIGMAQRYLAIEQVRFGERLRLEWNLDERANGARLPPLLLQPLVENAVKHGVEPSESGAQVRVSTERRGDSVVIRVTNTLPAAGAPARHGLGMALANVRQRLLLMHDVQAQFASGEKDGLFQVRMEVPA